MRDRYGLSNARMAVDRNIANLRAVSDLVDQLHPYVDSREECAAVTALAFAAEHAAHELQAALQRLQEATRG